MTRRFYSNSFESLFGYLTNLKIRTNITTGKERERRLIECRKTAEERKNYFESMERHMFARGSAVKETGRESISTSQEQVVRTIFQHSTQQN